MAKTYKIIERYYFDIDEFKWKKGNFVARGQWADGHLAYSLLDENGNEVEGEQCAYVQIRQEKMLVMTRI